MIPDHNVSIIEAHKNLRAILKSVHQMRRDGGPNVMLTQMLNDLSFMEIRDLCTLMAGQLSQIITVWLSPKLDVDELETIDMLTEDGFVE